MMKREDMIMNAEQTMGDLSLGDVLQASQKLHVALQDIKRMEKYMTPAQKEKVVELVKRALGSEGAQ